MPISNKDIANLFLDYADTIEKEGENPYRARAYRRAARSIAHLSIQLSTEIDTYDFTSIPYVGKNLALQIKNIIVTGNIIHTEPKKEKKFRRKDANKQPKYSIRKLKLFNAVPIVENLLNQLKNITDVKFATVASGYRRRKDLIEQVDILILLENAKAFKKILLLKEIKTILEKKNYSITVRLRSGIIMNFHFVNKKNYPFNLFWLTGSESHLEQLQNIAKNKNLIVNEQGLSKQNKSINIASEKKIYTQIGLDYIEPELRENRGEIEAAIARTLPKLIELTDIRGDLHCHTWETDGTESLETMVQAAADLGYDYIAITDHSKHLAITHGLDEKRLLNQIKLIDRLNNKFKSITILKSIEVDILEDGTLDLSNSVLKELDLCVCSIHSKFKLDADKQTERIIRAMDNPYFNILGHATGRILNYRSPYSLDVEKIFIAAKERNCFIELNAQPSRLDINDAYCQLAKNIGVKIALSSDAHSIRELSFMQYGIYQARRGWLEASDVINTRSLKELKALLKR